MEYSLKWLIQISDTRNKPKILMFVIIMLVFLGETGINLHRTRNEGYSSKNMKAYKIVKENRGMNFSCMVLIVRFTE